MQRKDTFVEDVCSRLSLHTWRSNFGWRLKGTPSRAAEDEHRQEVSVLPEEL